MKTIKLILTLTYGRNLPLMTVNRQNRQTLTVNRQSYTPIETL